MSIDRPNATITTGNEIVIFLDEDDEISTVRAKLERVRGQRVALVVPSTNENFKRSVALRLLRRLAETFAIDLSLISADSEVQRLAKDENVRIFASVRGFRRYAQGPERARTGREANQRLDRVSRAIVLLGSALAILLVAAILAFLLIPSITVTLRPAAEPIGDTIELRADPAARNIDYVNRRVPARAIYDLVEGSDQVPVTGVGPAGQSRAQGRVTFKNRTGQEIAVPKGTIVLTPDKVKFVTVGDVHLAPARGDWVQVDVQAVDVGPSGVVPRGRISVIEGPLTQQLDVLNEEPTVSGEPGVLGIVSEADQKRLREQLYARLSQEAMAKLKSGVGKDETLPDQTIRLVTMEESYDRRVGEQAKALNLRMSVRVNGTAFMAEDAYNLAERAWQPKPRPGFAIVPDTVKLLPAEVARVDGDVVVLRVRVDGTAAAVANEAQMINAVRWRSAREAVDELSRTFVLAEQPQVKIEPEWAKRALRVRVDVKN